MTARLSLLCLAAAAALTGGLAALPWFAVRTPGGRIEASGLASSAELWTLPVAGAAGLAAAVLLVVRPGPFPGWRRALTLAVVPASALAVLWSLENALRPPVAIEITTPGDPPERLPEALAATDVRPAAYLAAAAAAIMGMAALLHALEERA